MRIQLPYGDYMVPIDVPARNLLDVAQPRSPPGGNPKDIIREALQRPEGAPRLGELVGPRSTIAIVVDDQTRPCPTAMMLPLVLEEASVSNVKIIVGNGTHTPPTEGQIKRILGHSYRCTWNDAKGKDFAQVGTTSRGTPVEIERAYMEADVGVLLGDIEYHYFAGYGGGRKSILPGISSYETTQHNHKLMFHPLSTTGVLAGNPVHEDMMEGADLAGVDFVLNVVQHHGVVGAFAGDHRAVLSGGVSMVDDLCKVRVKDRADVVVVAADGGPHDINLYQAHKALATALRVVRDNGVVVLVAECREGHGSDTFNDWMKRYKRADEIEARLREEFVIGAHKAYYLRRAQEKVSVIVASHMDQEELASFGLLSARTPQEALERGFAIMGPGAEVTVIPYGTTTLATL